jgi:hypothetical protein
MKKILLNPFEKYNELLLLVFGIILTVAGSILAFYCNARFDGVLDLHFGEGVTLWDPFIDNTINIVSLFIFLFTLGLIINRKTRVIDVFTTILIARVPFYLLSLVNCTNIMVRIQSNIDPANLYNITFSSSELIILILFSLVSILFLVWFVVLLYNGFKTATNIKQTSHKVMFGVTILLAEILSKIILYIL